MYKRYTRGFTLVELIAVLAILSIVTSVIMPSAAPQIPYQLELAAEKIARALRFARDEAIKTGEIIGVVIDGDNSYLSTGRQLVKVYHLDPTTTPFTVQDTLYSPVKKIPYEFSMQNVAPHSAVHLDPDKPFNYFSISSNTFSEHIHFDRSGIPMLFNDNKGSRLLGGEITLNSANNSLVVKVHSVTGRVTIYAP